MKKINRRNAIIIIVILGLCILGVITWIKKDQKDTEKQRQVTITETKLNDEASLVNNENTNISVEIAMDDCAVVIGNVFKVPVIVTPENTDKALLWTTSNSEVLTVTKDGVVTITGTGMAVLTATVGSVSDAVIIEGIESQSAGSKENLQTYDPINNVVIKNNGSNGSTSTGSTSTGNTSTGNTSTGNSSGNEEYSNDSVNTDNRTDSASNVTDSNQTQENTSSEQSNNEGNTNSLELTQALPDMGYEHRISNVYVYSDGSEYCGEIIVQPEVTIIYIKKRTTSFENSIKAVLKMLISENSQQIWNNYVNAHSDLTIPVGDKKVRIVVGVNGGHSQIVIYN